MPVKFFPMPSAEANWGNIQGDINNQTDLINVLSSKADSNHSHEGTSLPIGTLGNMLYHDGSDWISSTDIEHNSTNITINSKTIIDGSQISDSMYALEVIGENNTTAFASKGNKNPCSLQTYDYNGGETALKLTVGNGINTETDVDFLSCIKSSNSLEVFRVDFGGNIFADSLKTIQAHADSKKSLYVDTSNGKLYSQDTPAAGDLISTNNLSDLSDAASARSNLDLGNVTNDAQLKRSAGDFAVFASKSSPENSDLILIEDSSDSNTKKKVALSELSTAVKKTFEIPHTYIVQGEVKVASGDDDYIPPFFVSVPTTQSIKLKKAIYKIKSGTSVSCKLTKNGTDISGFTGLTVTTTKSSISAGTPVSLSDEDEIALQVTAVAGTPKNLSFTLILEYGV